MMRTDEMLPKRGLRTRRALEHAAIIGANLRDARRASDLDYRDLTLSLGVTKETYMGYERGARTLPLAMGPTLAHLLDMSWTQMFAGCDLPRRGGTAGALTAAPELMDILRRVDALEPDARAQLREMLTGGARVRG